MIVAGVRTGVRFSNFKNCRNRIQKFWNRSQAESEKVTPATSAIQIRLQERKPRSRSCRKHLEPRSIKSKTHSMHASGTEAKLLVNGGTGVQILIFTLGSNTVLQIFNTNPLQYRCQGKFLTCEISDFTPCAHGANGVRPPHLKSVPAVSRLAHRLPHTSNTVSSKSSPPSGFWPNPLPNSGDGPVSNKLRKHILSKIDSNQ